MECVFSDREIENQCYINRYIFILYVLIEILKHIILFITMSFSSAVLCLNVQREIMIIHLLLRNYLTLFDLVKSRRRNSIGSAWDDLAPKWGSMMLYAKWNTRIENQKLLLTRKRHSVPWKSCRKYLRV